VGGTQGHQYQLRCGHVCSRWWKKRRRRGARGGGGWGGGGGGHWRFSRPSRTTDVVYAPEPASYDTQGAVPRALVLLAASRGLKKGFGRHALLSALVLERVTGQASYGLYQTGCSALCSDLAEGSALVGLSTRVAGCAALGVVLGPLLGGRVAEMTGSPSATFWVSATLGGLQLLLTALGLPETLPPERRRELSAVAGQAVAPRNPLAMLRLFTTSPTLAVLATSTLLQCLTENKSILDICTAYAGTDIGCVTCVSCRE
jgi:MFS family permease